MTIVNHPKATLPSEGEIERRKIVALVLQQHDQDKIPGGYANGFPCDDVSDWSLWLADQVLAALSAHKPSGDNDQRASGESMTGDLRVVAAAILLDGFTAVAWPRERHHNIINNLAATGFPTPVGGIQGFILNTGGFVGRRAAMAVAVAANQLIPREGQNGPDGDLYSEDLW